MTLLIILLVVAVVVIIFAFATSSNKDEKYYAKKASTMSDTELKNAFSAVVLELVLHEKVVKIKGKYEAERACKYEKYNCNNYQEVIMFKNALSAEMEKRKLSV